jgi:hypothetical protein
MERNVSFSSSLSLTESPLSRFFSVKIFQPVLCADDLVEESDNGEHIDEEDHDSRLNPLKVSSRE